MTSRERARGFPAFAARTRSGRKFAASWWGNSWVTAMEDAALDPDQLKKGRRYALTGHVGSIAISPGRVAAPVHDGDDLTPYSTTVRVEQLTDAEWSRFLDQVGTKAGHIAALLDGEVPPDLVESADAAGVRLLPSVGDLEPVCDCLDWDHPCKHAAALAYQVSWLLDIDPFVLLLLRGRSRDELLDELQLRDGDDGDQRPGVPAAQAYVAQPAPLPDLQEVPDQRRPLAAVLTGIAVEGVDHSALDLLAADAALRARALLAGHDDPATGPADEWTDAVRLAASHPVHPAARVLASDDRAAGLARAVAAWTAGGTAGLDVLIAAWSPPPAVLTRARAMIEDAWSDSGLGAGPILEIWRNRVTARGSGVQVRYGRDGRWHPYRQEGGDWAPAGPAQADPVDAVLLLLQV